MSIQSCKRLMLIWKLIPGPGIFADVVERLNQTLLEHARVMLFAKDLPKTLWPEAVAYSNYIKNRSLTRALGSEIMPYQVFFKKKPDVSRLEEFGTKCWVMVPDQRCSKLDPKAEMHIFVRVAEHAKAWNYFNKISRHVQMSRNITFDEHDTKLYPIPNEDDEDELLASLEGESHSGERTPGTTQGDLSTPQMSPNSSAIPSTQVLTPIP